MKRPCQNVVEKSPSIIECKVSGSKVPVNIWVKRHCQYMGEKALSKFGWKVTVNNGVKSQSIYEWKVAVNIWVKRHCHYMDEKSPSICGWKVTVKIWMKSHGQNVGNVTVKMWAESHCQYMGEKSLLISPIYWWWLFTHIDSVFYPYM